MHKIKSFICSNYSEILSVFSLVTIFLLLSFFFGHSYGIALIDSGREAYLPEAILKGKVLYRDIFDNYGPLAYQINALLYKVFGINLNVLRLAGIFNSLIIVFLLYAISRLFTSKEISWVNVCFIIVTCIFNDYINYIYPYAYAVTYAFSACLFSILFLLLYLKTFKQVFIPLSWFFIGISMASKYEYIPYLIFLFFFTVFIKFYKKVDAKYILYSIISFLIVPVISFSILFLQGLTFSELWSQIQLIKKFALSPSLNYFYANSVGLYPNKANFIISRNVFEQISISFGLLMAGIYFAFKKINSQALNLFFIVSLLCCLYPYLVKYSNPVAVFFPLLILSVFGLMLFKMIKKEKYSYGITYSVFIAIAIIISTNPFFFNNFYFNADVFSFITFLISILFLYLYLRTFKNIFIYLNWFILGISISLRYEYVFYAIFMMLLVNFINRKNISVRNVLYGVFFLSIAPLIMCSNANKFYFTENVLFSTEIFKHIFLNYINLTIIAVGTILFFLKSKKINLENINNYILSIIFLLFFSNGIYSGIAQSLKTPYAIFSWAPMFILIVSFIVLIKWIKDKDYFTDGVYFFFLILALIASARSFFFLTMQYFGIYTLPLVFIAGSIFIVEYLPLWFETIEKKTLKLAFFVVILSTALFYLQHVVLIHHNTYTIKTEKGNLYDYFEDKYVVRATDEVINYIRKNAKPNASIWVIPEGNMINFLTDHPSNGTYYSIIPPYLDTFGEDKIIADTKRNDIDYIIVDSRLSKEYGHTRLCKDYGFKICNYVKSSYIPVAKFGDEFKMVIYKKKNK